MIRENPYLCINQILKSKDMNKFTFPSVCMALLLSVCLFSCTKKGMVVSSQPLPVDSIVYTIEDFDTTGFQPIPDRHVLFLPPFNEMMRVKVDRKGWLERNMLAFRSIVPNERYVYWECIRWGESTPYQTVVKMGDYKNILKKEELFTQPCFILSPEELYGIVALTSENKLRVIDTSDEFKEFIGTVDNLNEALFIASMHDLCYSPEMIKTGSYKKKGEDYLLYLQDYESFNDSFYFVRCVVKQDGTFIHLGRELYWERGKIGSVW